jgi:hypothetical protein
MQNSPSVTSNEILFKIWLAPKYFESRCTDKEAIRLSSVTELDRFGF